MTRLAGYLVACILSGLSSPAWAGEEEAAASSVDVQALEEAYAELLDPFVDQKRLPGYYFALYRDGLPVLVRARGFADEKTQLPPSGQTLYAVASMTKPLTALAVIKLVEMGKLALSDPLEQYVPSLAKLLVAPGGSYDNQLVPSERSITIADLLAHTSGLTYSTGITGVGDIAEAYKELGIFTIESSASSKIGDLAGHIEQLSELPLISQPGREFNYSVSYGVLAQVIEAVAETSFDAFMQDQIFLPLGMVNTFFTVPEEKQDRLARLYAPLRRTYQVPGTPKMYQEANILPKPLKNFGIEVDVIGGGNGLLTTAEDYAKFLSFLVRRGQGSALGLSQASFDYLLKDQVGRTLGPAFMTRNLGPQMENWGFSFGLGIKLEPGAGLDDSTGYDFLGWGGAFNTQFWIDPSSGVSGIFMTQHFPTRYPLTEKMDEVADRFFQ